MSGAIWRRAKRAIGRWADGSHPATILFPIRAVRDIRGPFVIYKSGPDWVHRWRGGILYWHEPVPHARSMTEGNLPLFTHRYLPKTGDTVIDVGAGVGTELIAFSRLVGPSGCVIAVEADPESFRRLRRVANTMGLTNVRLINLAVAATEGTAMLVRDGLGGVSNFLGYGDSAVEVKTTTLDRILDGLHGTSVDFVKMNIEGAESAALRGCERNWQKVNHWCISCHDFLGPTSATSEFVTDWLSARGLEVYRHPEEPERPWVGGYVFASSPTRSRA